MRKSWRCGTKHAVITPITIVHTLLVWWTQIIIEMKSLWCERPMFKYKTSSFVCDYHWWMQKCSLSSQVYIRSVWTYFDFNQLWTVTFVPTEWVQHKSYMVWVCTVLSCDHSQTTRCHTKIGGGLGWWIHGSVEDTKLSTNKQPSLSVIKKINGGRSHHLVNPIMFWYQHPLKKCEFVPISLNHVQLGWKDIPKPCVPKWPCGWGLVSNNTLEARSGKTSGPNGHQVHLIV
jgi:hypothetical protein